MNVTFLLTVDYSLSYIIGVAELMSLGIYIYIYMYICRTLIITLSEGCLVARKMLRLNVYRVKH